MKRILRFQKISGYTLRWTHRYEFSNVNFLSFLDHKLPRSTIAEYFYMWDTFWIHNSKIFEGNLTMKIASLNKKAQISQFDQVG